MSTLKCYSGLVQCQEDNHKPAEVAATMTPALSMNTLSNGRRAVCPSPRPAPPHARYLHYLDHRMAAPRSNQPLFALDRGEGVVYNCYIHESLDGMHRV